MKKILIIGSKNTYRSIIVAECLKKAIKNRGNFEIEVLSTGIMAFPDIPAEPEAVAQLKELSIEGDFKSTPLQKKVLAEADIILTMSEKIKIAILSKFAEKKESAFTFKEFAGEAELDFTASGKTGAEASALIDKNIDKFCK